MKQYLLKLNENNIEDTEIIKFLQSSSNKNRLMKDAVKLLLILSESYNTVDIVRLAYNISNKSADNSLETATITKDNCSNNINVNVDELDSILDNI